METRFLGRSGLKVSALGFGAGTFGGKGPLFSAWGNTDVTEARRMIDLSLDAGLAFADDDMLAEHRDSTEKLLIAVVRGAVQIDGLFEHLQRRRRIQAQHFGVTRRRFADGAEVGDDLGVLAVDRLDVLLVQVGALGRDRRAGGNGQSQCRERGETTNHRLMREIAHCTIPLLRNDFF